MTELAATVPAPASSTDSEESGWARLRWVVLLSVAVTAAAALFAIVPAALLDVHWSVAFVITRWLVVFALLALPLVHQAATRLGIGWSLPWGLRTPATGLLLTLEGIAWDIASANL